MTFWQPNVWAMGHLIDKLSIFLSYTKVPLLRLEARNVSEIRFYSVLGTDLRTFEF